MSMLSISSALQAALGFGLLAAFATIFRPLLTGTYRALKLAVKPGMSREQRLARAYSRNAMVLHSMTSSGDDLSPNLVAELRALSDRS
ncbi:hypothetical protein [Herminiimonas sp. CN]|uniref:hypothetical protein n=1 Tax=Herminiimonas sp. CN TaxID=1349818 RepID=UPI0006867F24|nr:hypothetical protein [Herminiimonas sp. CN]